MNKSLWQWEKHHIANYLRENFLETEVEFTTQSLIKKINNSKYHFGYEYKIISKHLSDLLNDGYLEVRYTSVKMEPDYRYHRGNENRFGSKTVSVYKMVNREEKIKKIFN